MLIKKGDFVELDYTARLKDDKIIFDTTDEETAKTSGNYRPGYKYQPATICVGERHLIPGLDDFLVGKNPGKFTVEIPADKGFGKKRTELLKMIPMRLFKKDKVDPIPGMDVTVDGEVGIVKSAGGGRVIVDFNHPLSGRDLVYDIHVKKIVTDPAEQIRAVLTMLHMPFDGIDITDSKAAVELTQALPEQITSEIAKDIQRMTGLKEVAFALKKGAGHKHAEHKHE